MRMSRRAKLVAVAGVALLASAAGAAETRYGIGRPATNAEIAAWNLDVDRDGKALPAGSGSVERGRVVFNEQCAACHGEKGEGGIGDRLVGGQGTLNTPKPIKTVGSLRLCRTRHVRRLADHSIFSPG